MKKLLILLFTILICGSISNISQTGTTQTITAGDEIPPYVWHDPLLLQDMIQRGELTVEQLTTALETELPDPTRDNRILQTLHDLSTQQPDLLNPDRLAEIEEGYYGRMAGDFTRRPEVYADNDSDPGAKDIGDGAYDLKMSEPNITGESNFGYCVAKAGDVNNDGFDDVIIGAYRYNRDTGRSYIYYGDVSMDNTADVTLDGEGIYNFFGYSVSGAGDVNNDGYDDVIVGAYGYNNLIGRSYIYYGGAAMDNTADVTLDGEGPGNHFGISVSGAGDVNNDGYDDVIVGAWRYNSDTGRSYIYYGGAAMDNTADVTLDGEGTENWFGISLSGAGDVNNDGFDDVIVGAREYNNLTCRSYIYYGGPAMDNTADIILDGEDTDNEFDVSVSGAGDLNNDGFDDVIVGAWGHNSKAGRAYVYFGGIGMDATADVTLDGQGITNRFGYSVSNIGDVNQDGFDDVIVGDNSSTGRAFIYYGRTDMDATPDVTLTGEATSNNFGWSITSAGDVNQDGTDDVIVGSCVYNSGRGRAYIYYGGTGMNATADVTLDGVATNNRFGCSVSNAGDVNNDGFDDVIVGATGYNVSTGRAYIFYGEAGMDATADVFLTGEGKFSGFGVSVSNAGDVNNDGFADVIVGAYQYNNHTGRAYVYYGGAGMDSTADVFLTGEGADNEFGRSVSYAGDVNNDGYDDLIVGASGYNSNTGRTYIYYGWIKMDVASDVILTGDKKLNYFGASVSNAGDVNRDGFDDVIVGATGYDPFSERRYIYYDIYYGGAGMDVTADVTLTGEGPGDRIGTSISSAGDVNHDGFDDVIVGATGYSTNTVRAIIYFGGASMDATVDVFLDGKGKDNNFGTSVSNAGDVNHDGIDDVIVGTPDHPLNGAAYIY